MLQTPSSSTPAPHAREARQWTLTGQVQGVGFRPFVYRLAHAHGLAGWVRNRLGEVEIHAEGDRAALDRFGAALITDAPPLARPQLERTLRVATDGLTGFEIRDSAATDTPRIHVPPDYFACADCLREVDDPQDRRYAYPFTNCTQCGPRYTLIERLPYDRVNTSMAGFPLCPACQREYTDPLDRRFHAEPTACPVCGPRLTFVSGDTTLEGNPDALTATLTALRAGQIVAIKGVGGYHLVCDARNTDAVTTLRARKPRPAKPLAVMFPDLAWAERCVELRDAERALLCSPMRPIVLARKSSPLPRSSPASSEGRLQQPCGQHARGEHRTGAKRNRRAAAVCATASSTVPCLRRALSDDLGQSQRRTRADGQYRSAEPTGAHRRCLSAS